MDSSLSSSQSLEIQEPLNKIAFSSSDDDQMESADHILDYSMEDESLSFQIDCFDSTDQKAKEVEHVSHIINNDPPKRRRREIFEKYRQPVVQEILMHESHSVGQD